MEVFDGNQSQEISIFLLVLHFTLDESTERFGIGFKIENYLIGCTLGDESRLSKCSAGQVGLPITWAHQTFRNWIFAIISKLWEIQGLNTLFLQPGGGPLSCCIEEWNPSEILT